MRLLRPMLLALLALAVATAGAVAQQSTIPLPGGGTVTIKLPLEKGKKAKKKRSNKVTVGIADEKADMFDDPRFTALGIKTARRSVAWDVFKYDFALHEVDDWMKRAQAAGVKPLITFGRSRIDSQRDVIPTRAQMLSTFKQFRAKYPWVTDYVASNESNYSRPGVKQPGLMAKYYLDMRKACRTCKVAAATLLEVPGKGWERSMARWVKRFVKSAGHRPKYWAAHNYFSVNGLSLKGTKNILKVTKKGELWVTETGGLVARRSTFAGKIPMKEGLAHSVRVTKFIFDKMLTLSPRIKRIYLYHWNSATPTDSWDSGLIGHDGKPRGSYTVVAAKLKKRR